MIHAIRSLTKAYGQKHVHSSLLGTFNFSLGPASLFKKCAIRSLTKSYTQKSIHMSAIGTNALARPVSLSIGTTTTNTLRIGSSQARWLCQEAGVAAAPDTNRNIPVTLYQYEPCPYCCKVKAVLDFNQVPYRVVEVNPVSKKETKFSDYNKVPLAIINGVEVRDSNDIIQSIQSQFGKNTSTSSTNEDGQKSQEWVDAQFIRLMPPNIYRTIPESLQAFEYVLTEGKFTWTERAMAKYIGAGAMYLISKKLKTKYKIEDPREALYHAVDEYLATIEPTEPFSGGQEPNLADVTIFGVMRSIEGLDTFDDLMTHNAAIQEWFIRMSKVVGPSSRISEKEEQIELK